MLPVVFGKSQICDGGGLLLLLSADVKYDGRSRNE